MLEATKYHIEVLQMAAAVCRKNMRMSAGWGDMVSAEIQERSARELYQDAREAMGVKDADQYYA